MAVPGGPVACFSYLAGASLWRVGRFPAANHGAEITTIEESIAADGPVVAAVLEALGQPGVLIANSVGNDPTGAQVHSWLERHQVETTEDIQAGAATPRIVVIGDSHHTRTMFPYLPGVADELEHVDLALLSDASFAYIDCYGMIAKAAARAIRAARNAGLSLLANLGGDNPSTEMLDALDGYPNVVIQTSIAEESLETATRLVEYVRADMQCEWAVITAGKAGAAAASARDLIRTPAFHADVHHTHCAGAAFSGGLAYGLVRGWPMHDSLDLASASGALRCERMHDDPIPTLAELRTFMGSRERVTVEAA
jgi:sugar/nucleoside kinase (ribokinase family)